MRARSANLLCALLPLLANTTPANAEEQRISSIGIHDIAVRDVDSHTFGITAKLLIDEQTSFGLHLLGDLDVFWDHDQDHLDPDHIPIWWQLHAETDGGLWKPGGRFHVDWMVDANTRANTVSSVERQIAVLPAIAARFDADKLHASLVGGYGYWFLEIDDDAPRERGYEREGLRKTTWAESLGWDLTIRAASSVTVAAHAQGWWDGTEWLYAHYAGELHLSTARWLRASEIVLAAEFNEYNFDLYNKPGLLPVLPWNDDMLFTVRLTRAW